MQCLTDRQPCSGRSWRALVIGIDQSWWRAIFRVPPLSRSHSVPSQAEEARALLEDIDPLAAAEQPHRLGSDDEQLAFVRHAHAVPQRPGRQVRGPRRTAGALDLQSTRERLLSDRKGRPRPPGPGAGASALLRAFRGGVPHRPRAAPPTAPTARTAASRWPVSDLVPTGEQQAASGGLVVGGEPAPAADRLRAVPPGSTVPLGRNW